MEHNLQEIDAIIDQWGPKPSSLLQIMLDVNQKYHYLPRESIDRIARASICRSHRFTVLPPSSRFSA